MNTIAKKPVINHTSKIIIVTEKFFRAASNPANNEVSDLMKLRKALPGYEVITRSHNKPRKTENTQNIKKFVPYDKMEKYIRLLPNSEALLEQFELVKDYAACRRNSATIVFNWFHETFPDYRHAPKIDKEGNLVARVNVVSMEDYKKAKEEKKKAELPLAAVPQDTEGTDERKEA